jgi:hypothetical protein
VPLLLILSGCASGVVCEYVPSNTLTPIVQAHVSPPIVEAPELEPLPPPAPPPARRSQQSRRPTSSQPGGFRLNPETPETGTPEAAREEEQSNRRERELNRQMRGICRGC